nr:hypothetical protein [Tanacetum cinerariifolium]
GKHIARESSTPKTSLKIRIKLKKSTLTAPLPPSDDKERDDITKATQLKKLLEGEDESSGSEFTDTMLLSDEDFGDRLENRSHKENQKEIDDDDDKKKDDKHDDAKENEDKDNDDDQNDQ